MNEQDLIETRKVLEQYGTETLDSMRDILLSAGKDASGTLINSLRYTITYNGTDLDLEFEMVDYGIFVDQGRKPGKQPPLSAIKPWLAIRGIPEKYAFPIARNIGKRGIKATPFFQSTVDKTEATLAEELATAYALDIDNYLQKQFNQ